MHITHEPEAHKIIQPTGMYVFYLKYLYNIYVFNTATGDLSLSVMRPDCVADILFISYCRGLECV